MLNSNGAAPPQNWASQNRPNLGQGRDCRGRRNQRWVPGGEDSEEAVPIFRRKKRGNNQWFLNLLCCVLGRWFESLSFCFENQTFSSSKLQFSH